MDDLKDILAKIPILLERGATPAEIGEWLTVKTGGKVTSIEQAQQLAATEAKGKTSKLGLIRPAAQGAFFNFADELAGVGTAVVPGGRGYREGRDAFRAAEAATRADYPG